MHIGPGVDYPKTDDYILERNLKKCQQTKTGVLTVNVQIQSYLSRMSKIRTNKERYKKQKPYTDTRGSQFTSANMAFKIEF